MAHRLTAVLAKDADSTLDYELLWSNWLSDGDSIDSATWTVTRGTVTVAESPAPSILDGNTARVWLTGGTAGEVASIRCRIVTALGRTDERTVKVQVT